MRLSIVYFLGFGNLCLTFLKYQFDMVQIQASSLIGINTYITGPSNGTICGSHVEIKLHVDLTEIDTNRRVNNYYDDINICIYRNNIFFACMESYNPHYALVCEVGYGNTVIDIYAAHSTPPRMDPHSHPDASVTVFRPVLTNNTTGDSATLDGLETHVLSTSEETTGASMEPLHRMLSALSPLYNPFHPSVLVYSDRFRQQDSSRADGEGVLYDPAVAALLLVPLRLVLLSANPPLFSNQLDKRFCTRFAAPYVRCDNISMNNDISAAVYQNMREVPPVLHVSVAYITQCPSDPDTNANAERMQVLRQLAEVVLKRTTLHFVVLLSRECYLAGAVDKHLLQDADQRFDFEETGQIGFVFVSPVDRRQESVPVSVSVSAPTADDGPRVSQLEHRDRTNGAHPVLPAMHELRLRNACLLYNNSLVVFTPWRGKQYTDSNRRYHNQMFNASITAHLNAIGFLPWVRRHDSTHPVGTNGFTNIFELEVDSKGEKAKSGSVGPGVINAAYWNGKKANLEGLVWSTQKTLLVRPYYKSNIFHFVQSLAVLLDRASGTSSVNVGAGIGTGTGTGTDTMRDTNVLLIDYFTSGYNLEWCDSFLESAQHWLDQTLINSNHPGTYKYFSQEQTYGLFESHLASFVPEIDAEHKMLCFEDLTLTGQGSTDVGFFRHHEALGRFRELIWQRTNPSLYESLCTAATRRGRGNDYRSCPSESILLVDKHPTPFVADNSPVLLKVTIVLRTHNRFILNYHELLEMLRSSYFNRIIDQEWLNSEHHSGISFDTLSFKEQVSIVMETDILIAVHGSVFTNAMFMSPDSAAIALMQSRHIEYVLVQVIEQGGVHFEFVPLLNQNNTSGCACVSCRGTHTGVETGTEAKAEGAYIDHMGGQVTKPSHIYPDICEGANTSLIRAAQMDCLGIRQCNPMVDLHLLETILIKMARKVFASKYKNRKNQLISTSTIVSGEGY